MLGELNLVARWHGLIKIRGCREGGGAISAIRLAGPGTVSRRAAELIRLGEFKLQS